MQDTYTFSLSLSPHRESTPLRTFPRFLPSVDTLIFSEIYCSADRRYITHRGPRYIHSVVGFPASRFLLVLSGFACVASLKDGKSAELALTWRLPGRLRLLWRARPFHFRHKRELGSPELGSPHLHRFAKAYFTLKLDYVLQAARTYLSTQARYCSYSAISYLFTIYIRLSDTCTRIALQSDTRHLRGRRKELKNRPR